MDVVYATETRIVGVTPYRSITVIYGTHWPADDPVVKRNPDLFSDDPIYGLFASEDPSKSGDLESAEPVRRGPGRPKKAA